MMIMMMMVMMISSNTNNYHNNKAYLYSLENVIFVKSLLDKMYFYSLRILLLYFVFPVPTKKQHPF